LKRAITPYSLKNLATIVSKSNFNNYKFYKELYMEFSNYFLRKQQQNDVTAFFHLYRILESIAYCFPLIWASRAKDYEGTFSRLRTYFNGPETGELKVFTKFMEDIIDHNLLNTQVTLILKSVHPDWQQSYYNTIYNTINSKNSQDITFSSPNSTITIKCHCLIDLMITIRNKYFHFLTGQGNNFFSDDIEEANEFFDIINDVLANWLSVIFFEIIDHELSTY
jgi:hypothetical protein